MHYCPQSRNILAAAAATLTNQVASTAMRRTSVSRTGNGIISLSGGYTGAADSTFDIEITSDAVSGDPTVSTPVFVGVGNGALSGLSVDPGTSAQTVTATLTDLGIPTRAAFAPFQSVTLQAKASGAHGNGIYVEIDQAGLTRTASDYSVTSEIQSGTAEYQGAEEYNFGAVNLEPEGSVPADAPRIAFGNDPMVYRHWRTFAGGRYSYHLSPAPVRDYPIGTPVYVVTGGRTVDISNSIGEAATAHATSTVYATASAVIPTTPNGLWYEATTGGTSAGTEPTWPTTAGATVTDNDITWTCRGKITTQYTSVATLYGLLSAIQADATALVNVDGVVANDRRPGGMACDDLVEFTASYAQDVSGEGTEFVQQAQIALTVASDAPTETLTITCADANAAGVEEWNVRGDVSGDLTRAITGVLYEGTDYTFTIPVQLLPANTPAGRASAVLDLLPGTREKTPSLCYRDLVLGRDATDRKIEFVWQWRTGEDCDCSTGAIIGGPNDDYLGIDPPEGGTMTEVPSAIQATLDTITSWANTFVKSQVGADDSAGDVLMEVSDALLDGKRLALLERISSTLQIDNVDVQIANEAASIWRRVVWAIYNGAGEWSTDVNTLFGTEFSNFTTFMTDGFGSLVGADFVARIRQYATNSAVGTPTSLPAIYLAETDPIFTGWAASHGAKFITQSIERIKDRVRWQANELMNEAGLDWLFFADATAAGSGVWQDHKKEGWWVAKEGGYLPIQNDVYYHSAINSPDEFGTLVPTPTYEFGIGVSVGCEESLLDGDILRLDFDRIVNPRRTYQVGDRITARIVRADPTELGGGQTGNDTLTWRVEASVDGPLDDYALVTTSPAAYSDGGIDFLITPGAIAYELGDVYSFAIEGGQFRWRQDGGSWTSGVDIAPTVALADGLSAVFSGGAPPSFVVGDAWSFQAMATNGVDRLRTPDDRSARWTGSTVIEFAGDPLDALLLWHNIPSTATVRLQGSDDGFSSTPFDQVLPWRRDVIALRLATAIDYAEYRITVDDSGSLRWGFAGLGLQPALPNGIKEPGAVSMTGRLQRPGSIRGRDAQIEHTHCTQASVDALLDALEDATENHDGVIGMLLADGEGYMVTVSDAVPLDDRLTFHPDDPAHRLVGVRVQLGAAA